MDDGSSIDFLDAFEYSGSQVVEGLDSDMVLVMRRTFATLSKEAGVDAHARSAQMGNTVDVNENGYAVESFEKKLAAVRRLESALVHPKNGSQSFAWGQK